MCDTCTDLLNEALNLAHRSDVFEEQNRRQAALAASINPGKWEESGMFDKYVDLQNVENPSYQIATKSLTMHLWVQDQYEKDLADWQVRSRAHILQHHQ